jgi:hypothetical protein
VGAVSGGLEPYNSKRSCVSVHNLLRLTRRAMKTPAHEVLGVEPTASPEQVRTAYRKLVQIYHPDRFAAAGPQVKEEAERRMMELNAAFHEMTRGSSFAPTSDEAASAWDPRWDRIWARDEAWYQENRRRGEEETKRRRVHERWKLIERLARERAQAWEPSAEADAGQRAELPEASEGKVRHFSPPRTGTQGAVDAYRTAQHLRETIDLTDANRRKAESATDG